MLKSNTRVFLSLLLSLLIVNPSGLLAASTPVAAPRSALGSIESYGAVRVDEILVPAEATLFAGDRVQTNNGGAVVQYRKGARVSMATESVADFAAERVQLEKGLMRFETSSNGITFAASTLLLKPTAAKTIANVTLRDSKASVSVTEGTLKVMNPSGVLLASLNAGDARMFEEAPDSAPASPSASAPSPGAPPPAVNSGQSTAAICSSCGGNKWLIGVGAGVVGLGLGIAALVHANDANSNANASASAAAQAGSQSAALATQLNALNAQAAALQAQLNAAVSASNQEKSLDAQLAAQVAALSQVQAQLSTLLSQIAAQGGQATPAQLTQLQALASQENQIQGNLTQIQNGFSSISPFRVG